ncbi:MAG: DUF4783 domain-containing protein [Bacteroidales bacterium]
MSILHKLSILLLTALLCLSNHLVVAQTIERFFEELESYIWESNTDSLLAKFDKTIDLALPQGDMTYPAKEAINLLQVFFVDYPPDHVERLHLGGKGEQYYTVGVLTTATKRFRTTIQLRIQDQKYIIQQLRFDHEH